MTKRLFDCIISSFLLLIFLPLFVFIALLVQFSSKGGVFYTQKRVGQGGKPFGMFKFRTMYVDADKKSLLTIGDHDPRVTVVGFYLRKYKIDELPQLFNVWLGTMSLVGPRPEVSRYTDLYTDEQRQILNVKPGITDYASIEYADESELLAQAADPEKEYIEQIMPRKIALNQRYIAEQGVFVDIKIILLTLLKIVRKK